MVLWVRKDLWGSLVQPCAHSKAPFKLDHITQGHVKLNSEYLDGWRYPSLSGHLLKSSTTLAR